MSDYYDILSHENVNENNEGRWVIRLNEEAEVYRGHFPGQPIAPGACNIEMIRQLASQLKGQEVHFGEITQCRFTHLITPTIENPLTIRITLNDHKLLGTIHHEETLCVQMKATLQ